MLVFRQAYAALSEESSFQSPEYSSDSLKNSPLADFRNTLYWNPDLHTREDGTSSFEFYTSDETGRLYGHPGRKISGRAVRIHLPVN